ncbi:MAG: DUF2007 domain-containing protein [Planctomycetes bacterium]|jgi:hypothetical protein|nr:DUF2007 domain-containing protein [Planctomycetota bacterium]
MDDQDLVSVFSVNTLPEAEIIRGMLQSAGIACQIGGETQAGLAGVFAIDILTHASDSKKASKLLKEAQKAKKRRKKKRIAARKAKAQEAGSEAIQELKPDTKIKKKKS